MVKIGQNEQPTARSRIFQSAASMEQASTLRKGGGGTVVRSHSLLVLVSPLLLGQWSCTPDLVLESAAEQVLHGRPCHWLCSLR
jgi:hypothetical protein